MARVLGIVCARHDHHVGASRPHRPDHVVDRRGVEGDDHARRLVDAAAPQEQGIGGVAVVDRPAELAPAFDRAVSRSAAM